MLKARVLQDHETFLHLRNIPQLTIENRSEFMTEMQMNDQHNKIDIWNTAREALAEELIDTWLNMMDMIESTRSLAFVTTRLMEKHNLTAESEQAKSLIKATGYGSRLHNNRIHEV